MKYSYLWLQDFIRLESMEQTVLQLTQSGFETETPGGQNSQLIDTKIPTNRSLIEDCSTVYGMAREISILTNKKLQTYLGYLGQEKTEVASRRLQGCIVKEHHTQNMEKIYLRLLEQDVTLRENFYENFSSYLYSAYGIKITIKSEGPLHLLVEESELDVYQSYEAMGYAISLLTEGKNYGSDNVELVYRDNDSALPVVRKIFVNLEEIKDISGVKFSMAELKTCCSQLQLKPIQKNDAILSLEIPSYRKDLKLTSDILSDVLKIYGYDNIPRKLPKGVFLPIKDRHRYRSPSEVGYSEVKHFGFVSAASNAFTSEPRVKIQNPMSESMKEMRVSLVPQLIQRLNYNINRKAERVRLFEHATCFLRKEDGSLSMSKKIACLAYGGLYEDSWTKGENADFYSVKGDLEYLLNKDQEYELREESHPLLDKSCSTIIYKNGQAVGFLGRAKNQPLVIVFEIIAEEFLIEQPRFVSPPRFPSSKQDISLEIKDSVSAKEILRTIEKLANSFIEQVYVNDVYKINEGYKSLTISLVLRKKEDSLTDKEIKETVQELCAALEQDSTILAKIR